MAYYAKTIDVLNDKEYRVKAATLHTVNQSSTMSPTALITNNRPQPKNLPLATYTAMQDRQSQSSISLAMMQPHVVVTTNVQTAIPTATVSTGAGLPQLGHLILQTPKMDDGPRDQEKKIRREIANSNERRRMQTINAGFKSLKTILPHSDGEKLSKAAILQQTSEYILQLEGYKMKLLQQNERLRRAFADCKCNSPKHRALVCDIFDKDEGIGSPVEEDFEDMRRGIVDVRQQLDKEKRIRMLLEEQVRKYESQLFPEKNNGDSVIMSRHSSTDTRRSSSECSIDTIKSESESLSHGKSQNCIRPLIPPLAPLTSKPESVDNIAVTTSLTNENSNWGSQAPITELQPLATVVSNAPVIPHRTVVYPKSCNQMPKSAGQAITIFSHSVKSNQPLKKRAIEIHESFCDANEQVFSPQPKNKILKISMDNDNSIVHSMHNETHNPVTSVLAHTPCHNAPMPTYSAPVAVATLPSISFPQNLTTVSSPSLIRNFPVTTVAITPAQIPQNIQYPQIIGTNVALMATSLMQTVITPNPSINSYPISSFVAPTYNSVNTQEHMKGRIATTYVSSQITNEQHPVKCITTLPQSSANVRINECQNGNYNNVPRPQAPVDHTQQLQISRLGLEGGILPPSFPSQHVVVTPVDLKSGITQRDPLQQPMGSIRAQNMQINYAQMIQNPGMSTFCKIGSNLVSQSKLVTSNQVPIIPLHNAQCGGLAMSPTQPQLTQTAVLCYPQEITLNQLNAVPNLLPPPKSHQPVILPPPRSLVQLTAGSSPSYPGLQESVTLRPATFVAGRRRASSISATDSCSTASISGPEEDEMKSALLEDPDCPQSRVLTIKLSGTMEYPSVGVSPAQRTSQHYSVDSTIQESDTHRTGSRTPPETKVSEAIDVPDSGEKLSGPTLSVLSNVAGSPPIIRHIDAIQTRRNLETIVQAIDHLEQQERRNSQDQSCLSPKALSTDS